MMRLHRLIPCLIALTSLAASSIVGATTGTWSQTATRLKPGTSTPYPLREQAAVYDPIRNRVLVFGGQDASVFPNGPYTNEVWGLELSTSPNPQIWRLVNVSDAPGCTHPNPRARASMIYDPETDRVLVFGGYNPNGLNGLLWQLQLVSIPTNPTWCELDDSPTGRPAGSTASSDVRAVFDSARRRLLVISPTEGVFAIGLSGGAWTQVYQGPLGGYIGEQGYSAVYDSNSDRLLVFGGRKNLPSNLCGDEYASSTVYALSLETPTSWQAIATGAPSVADGGVTFDPGGNRVLVYGGERCAASAGGAQPLDTQLWELSLNVGGYTWQVVSAGGTVPPGRYGHTATIILARDVYVFGGTSNGTTDFATTYKFQPTDPALPEPRARHVSVYDPIRQRMIVWGGDDGFRLFSSDVWAMSLQPNSVPSWSKLNVTVQGNITTFGTRGAAAAFDTRRGVMYVQGGAPAMNTVPISDFLQLSFPDASSAVWSRPTIVGSVVPGYRMFHSMVYDSVGDQLYLYGGWDGFQTLGDTKQMTPGPSGVQWADVAVSPAPEPRYGYVSYFDAKRRRFILLGGEGNPYGGTHIGPAWALNVTGTPTWSTLGNSGGLAPGGLWFASAAYRIFDGNGAGMDQAYVTGGWFNQDNVWSNQQTWIHWLIDDFSAGWSALAFPDAPSNHVYQHTSIFDRLGNRTIRFGGSQFAGEQQTHPYDTTPTNVMNLSYQLATPGRAYDSVWSQIALYGVTVGGGGGGGGGKPPKKNFADQHPLALGEGPRAQILVRGGLGSTPVRFRLEGSSVSAPLHVRVFDVRGRLVRTLGGAASEVTWNRDNPYGLPVAPGVYAYRATAGNLTRTGKVMLTR